MLFMVNWACRGHADKRTWVEQERVVAGSGEVAMGAVMGCTHNLTHTGK